MGDLTSRPGWETCGSCSGYVTHPSPNPTNDEPWTCPDCVSGEVPSDGLIAAAAKAEYQHTEVWREELDSHKDLWRGQTRAALLAARRHEDTARNTGVTP